MTSTTSPLADSDADWHGPGSKRQSVRQFFRELTWAHMLWTFLYPKRGQRIMPTVSGILLISVALGIGSAAYNTSNNILFITLSLLLACLILSGVLSSLNFAKVAWRIVPTPPFRVGQTGTIGLELRNKKKILPTYGLWFDVHTRHEPKPQRFVLRERLDPQGGTARLDWTWQPTQRGLEVVELGAVGSLFPFGFLRKVLACEVRAEILVWPAPVEYQRFSILSPSRRQSGHAVARIGQTGDLLALRPYQQGDSHRLIHWKASARLRKLMIRQFSTEQQEGYSLHLNSSADLWAEADQFELLCSFVATLAEDLFTLGQLGTITIDNGTPRPVRSVRDLEAFFDDLADLSPRESTGRPSKAPFPSNALPTAVAPGAAHKLILTFAPEGHRGVAAYVNGEKAAAA
ncbi:MAG: hypothetical protein SynsKO_05420 [Synoicihabitans sp.]